MVVSQEVLRHFHNILVQIIRYDSQDNCYLQKTGEHGKVDSLYNHKALNNSVGQCLANYARQRKFGL